MLPRLVDPAVLLAIGVLTAANIPFYAQQQGPVSDALLALYQAAEVTVHESIGAWDPEQGLVVEASEASTDH